MTSESLDNALYGPRIPSRIGKAILATLVFFWPVGVVGLCYSFMVQSAIAKGDRAGARKLSDIANNLCNIAIGIGVAKFFYFFIVSANSYGY